MAKSVRCRSNYGAGRLAGLYADLGQNYLRNQAPALRDPLGAVVNQLLPETVVE